MKYILLLIGFLAIGVSAAVQKTSIAAVIKPTGLVGNKITLIATPGVNDCFVNWTQGGVQVSTSPTYTFTPTASTTLVANFVPAFVVSVSASPTTGGTVTGGGTFCAGSQVTVTAVPN